MSPEEFLEQWAALREELTNNRSREVLLVAHESLALIRLRVQSSGIDADGQSFGFYSAQYEKERERRNLRTDFIDLTATGGMWRELEVTIEEDEEEISTALVQGRTTRAIDLLEFNSDRYGDLLRLSDDEEDRITKAYFERKIELIQNFLQ
jgi:hypothetical protein